jgi:hypothetical protein
MNQMQLAGEFTAHPLRRDATENLGKDESIVEKQHGNSQGSEPRSAARAA